MINFEMIKTEDIEHKNEQELCPFRSWTHHDERLEK